MAQWHFIFCIRHICYAKGAPLEVRKEFDEKYRDSVLDPLQKFGHVLLCLLFMAEAIVVAWGLDQLRIHSIGLPGPEHKTLGIPNFLWAFSCPCLGILKESCVLETTLF